MDPGQFPEWVATVVTWGTQVPEIAMYVAYKIALPWIGLASVVAQLTPTEVDNKYLDRIINFFQASALNPSSAKARETVGFKKPK